MEMGWRGIASKEIMDVVGWTKVFIRSREIPSKTN
jgi:hypothetical protein